MVRSVRCLSSSCCSLALLGDFGLMSREKERKAPFSGEPGIPWPWTRDLDHVTYDISNTKKRWESRNRQLAALGNRAGITLFLFFSSVFSLFSLFSLLHLLIFISASSSPGLVRFCCVVVQHLLVVSSSTPHMASIYLRPV